MKKTILFVVAAMLMCCLHSSAAVPENGHCGQAKFKPWTAKAILTSTDTSPDETWINPDFDDSNWESISGPISSNEAFYHATDWYEEHNTYWIRRHVTIDEIADAYRFAVISDYGCDIYVNGHELFSGSYCPEIVFDLTEEMISWLKVGDNVFAIRAYGDGSPNTIDFGFIETSESEEVLENNAVTERSLPIELHSAEGAYGWYAQDDVIRTGDKTRIINYGYSLFSTVDVAGPTRLSFDYEVNFQSHMSYEFNFYVDDALYLNEIGYNNDKVNVSVVLPLGKHKLEWEFVRHYDYGNWSDYYAQISNIELISNWATITTETNGQVGKQAIYKFDRLDNSDLNFLKIVGPIGSAEQDDWNDIRNMKYLNALDLTEAKFDYVPDEAFRGMSRLSYVALPEGIKSIGDYAFNNTILYEIDIPSSVEVIGTEALSHNRLRKITFDEDSKLHTIGFAAFHTTDLEYFDMPQTVTTLGVNGYDEASTFGKCSRLKKVRFSDLITDLHIYTCESCSSLEEVILPSSLERIGRYAFYNTPSLKSVHLPETLRSIGNQAFCYSGLDSISLPVKLNTLSDWAFQGCNSLKYIELPSYIGEYYYNFYECRSLQTVVCKSATPPVIDRDPFEYCPAKGDMTLYVPEFALADYKLDNYWQQFGTILPIDVTLDYWRIAGRLDIPNDHRMGGKPDVDLYYGGKLTVTGTNPVDYGYLQYFAGESNPGTLINRTETFMTDSVNTVFPVGYDYWYFFTPLYDVKVSDIRHSDPSASMAIRYYNAKTRAEEGSGGWQNVTADELHAGIGYILHTNKDGDIHMPSKQASRNAMFETEVKATVLETNEAENAAHKNWNFVGNPYPCYFDIYYLDFTAPITIWDGRNFVAKSITDDEYALRPMQAFFVQKPDEIQNIVFAVDGRQHTPTVSRHNAPVRRTADPSRTVFNINIEGNGLSDMTRVVLNDSRSMSYEIECDASKFMSLDSAVPQIFTVNEGTRMAINERPQLDGTVALGMTFGAKGEYTISASRADGEVTLYDSETGITTDLTKADYTVSVDGACQMTDRLYLNVTATPTSIVDIEGSNTAEVAATDGGITVNAAGVCSVAVYSISGIEVFAGELTADETTIAVESGVYVVRIDDVTYKVIVK